MKRLVAATGHHQHQQQPAYRVGSGSMETTQEALRTYLERVVKASIVNFSKSQPATSGDNDNNINARGQKRKKKFICKDMVLEAVSMVDAEDKMHKKKCNM